MRIFLITAFLLSGYAFAIPELVCDSVVENFSGQTLGGFPSGFTSPDTALLKRTIAKNEYYTIAEDPDGVRFLRAATTGGSLTIFKATKGWDIDEYPYLRWKWRVHQLPRLANEKYIRTNDAAASVYAVWDANSLMKVKSIKFTWSSALAPGTHLVKRFGFDHVQVLREGHTKVGEWREETINLKSLHREYFELKNDEIVPSPLALAILSDGDSTSSTVAADYADFVLCREAITLPKPASVNTP